MQKALQTYKQRLMAVIDLYYFMLPYIEIFIYKWNDISSLVCDAQKGNVNKAIFSSKASTKWFH